MPAELRLTLGEPLPRGEPLGLPDTLMSSLLLDTAALEVPLLLPEPVRVAGAEAEPLPPLRLLL